MTLNIPKYLWTQYHPPNDVRSTYLCFNFIVSETEVLQVSCGIGLNGRELMLQHLYHFRQLRVSPPKLPVRKEAGEHEE